MVIWYGKTSIPRKFSIYNIRPHVSIVSKQRLAQEKQEINFNQNRSKYKKAENSVLQLETP